MKHPVMAMALVAALLGTWRPAHATAPRVTIATAPGAQLPTGVVEGVRSATESRVERLDDGPATIRIVLDDTGATIDVDGKHRRVAIDDWNDAAAPRFVVVHVLDLATPLPLVPSEVSSAAEVTGPELAAGHAPQAALEVYVAPRFARGVGAKDPSAPGVEVGTTIYRARLTLGASLGWTHGLGAGEGSAAEASYDTWPLRLALGWRRGAVEVRAAAVVAAYRFMGVTPQNGVQLGAGVALRCHGHLGDGMGWFLEAGVDAFAQRVQLEVAGVVAYSMPRVAPSLALGLSWELP